MTGVQTCALPIYHASIPEALAAYEAERKPLVASTQRAAAASREWFEHLPQYLGQEDLQFVFNLLTRSRRITYDNLRLRDPRFVEEVDRWFAGKVAAEAPAGTPPMFLPFRLRDLELMNRVVVSPMCQYSADDGCASEWHTGHLGMLANCGAGQVILEATHVERHGRITHGCLGLYSDDNEAELARVIAHCRRYGTAKFGVQLAHAGRKASSHRPWEGGGALKIGSDPWETIAPSPIAFGAGWHVPRVATLEDIARVRDAFVNSAKRAVRIGFDALRGGQRHPLEQPANGLGQVLRPAGFDERS